MMGQRDWGQVREFYERMISEALGKDKMARDKRWTENIAVGSDSFIKTMKKRLGYRETDRNSGWNACSWLQRGNIA